MVAKRVSSGILIDSGYGGTKGGGGGSRGNCGVIGGGLVPCVEVSEPCQEFLHGVPFTVWRATA